MLLFEMLFRYMLVMFICALAIAIPDLGDIISLIGAMASSMLALILPPIIDQLIKSNNPPTTRNKYYLISAKNLGKSWHNYYFQKHWGSHDLSILYS